jgi:hypothetical protein
LGYYCLFIIFRLGIYWLIRKEQLSWQTLGWWQACLILVVDDVQEKRLLELHAGAELNPANLTTIGLFKALLIARLVFVKISPFF